MDPNQTRDCNWQGIISWGRVKKKGGEKEMEGKGGGVKQPNSPTTGLKTKRHKNECNQKKNQDVGGGERGWGKRGEGGVGRTRKKDERRKKRSIHAAQVGRTAGLYHSSQNPFII